MEENTTPNTNPEEKIVAKTYEMNIQRVRLTKEIALGIVHLPGYQPILTKAGFNWQEQLAKDSKKLLDEIIKQYGEVKI